MSWDPKKFSRAQNRGADNLLETQLCCLLHPAAPKHGPALQTDCCSITQSSSGNTHRTPMNCLQQLSPPSSKQKNSRCYFALSLLHFHMPLCLRPLPLPRISSVPNVSNNISSLFQGCFVLPSSWTFVLHCSHRLGAHLYAAVISGDGLWCPSPKMKVINICVVTKYLGNCKHQLRTNLLSQFWQNKCPALSLELHGSQGAFPPQMWVQPIKHQKQQVFLDRLRWEVWASHRYKSKVKKNPAYLLIIFSPSTQRISSTSQLISRWRCSKCHDGGKTCD